MTQKKVLVTGATGFIGNYVIRELITRNVSIIATSSNQDKALKQNWFNFVTYIKHDIYTGPQVNLWEKFNKPDNIIHLAWDYLSDFKDQSHLTKILPNHQYFLENLIKTGAKDITCAGTCLEYGLREGCLDETMEPLPIVSYAKAKNELRIFLEKLIREHFYKLKWIRLFYLYGEGQNEKSLIPSLEKAIKSNDASFKMSKGDQIRDFLAVEEAVKYIVDISLQTNSGIFNCSSNQPISVKKMVEDYLHNRNKTIKLELGYYPYPEHEPLNFWGNNSKIKGIKNEPTG